MGACCSASAVEARPAETAASPSQKVNAGQEKKQRQQQQPTQPVAPKDVPTLLPAAPDEPEQGDPSGETVTLHLQDKPDTDGTALQEQQGEGSATIQEAANKLKQTTEQEATSEPTHGNRDLDAELAVQSGLNRLAHDTDAEKSNPQQPPLEASSAPQEQNYPANDEPQACIWDPDESTNFDDEDETGPKRHWKGNTVILDLGGYEARIGSVQNGIRTISMGKGGEQTISAGGVPQVFPSLIAEPHPHHANAEDMCRARWDELMDIMTGYIIGHNVQAAMHKIHFMRVRYLRSTDWVKQEKELRAVAGHAFRPVLQVAEEQKQDPASADSSFVIVVTPTQMTKGARAALTHYMFQCQDVPRLAMFPAAVVTLFATGVATGLVVDSGYEETRVTAVFEGHVVKHLTCAFALGGRHVTEYFAQLIADKNPEASKISQDTATMLKERYCYVAERGVGEEKAEVVEVDLELSLGEERFLAPELLFQPIMHTGEDTGLHVLLSKMIDKIDKEFRTQLCSRIVLSGGNCLFKGLSQRLQHELDRIYDKEAFKPAVFPLTAPNMAWSGASLLGRSSVFLNRHSVITGTQYFDDPETCHQSSDFSFATIYPTGHTDPDDFLD